jgi:hypothetical protein
MRLALLGKAGNISAGALNYRGNPRPLPLPLATEPGEFKDPPRS